MRLRYGAIVKNCVIARNTSQSQSGNSGGGGVAMGDAGTLVQNCIIEQNTAGFYGGGIYHSSGAILRNCLIRNNIAMNDAGTVGYGGAMRVFAQNADILSCTIVSNYAYTHGGGIYNNRAADYTARVDNCIVYFNKAGSTGTATSSNLYDTSASSSYSNCCVAGWASATAVVITNNNITANPQCVDWTNGNYRLSRNSRCINAGVNRDWMTNAVDLDGYRRVDKFSGVVDIGCYEYLPSGVVFSGF